MDHLQSWFGARSSAPLLQLLCEVFPQDHLVAGTPPVTSAIAYAPSPAPAPASASASASASAPASVPVLAPAAMLHPKSVSKWTFSAPRFFLKKSQNAVQAECDADEEGTQLQRPYVPPGRDRARSNVRPHQRHERDARFQNFKNPTQRATRTHALCTRKHSFVPLHHKSFVCGDISCLLT